MSGRIHCVAQGESIESLAYGAGLLPDTIWNDAENADLRNGGRTLHLLLPGDQVFIPDRRLRRVSRATEARHRFVVDVIPACLHVRFLDDEKPRAHAAYELRVDGGEIIRASTDGDGYVNHPVSPRALTATIHFANDAEDEQFVVYLGHLDPPTTPSGVQQRLRNLALFWGDDTADWDEATTSALAAFQQQRHINVTGKLDDATQHALVQAHGS